MPSARKRSTPDDLFERLWPVAERARGRGALSREDVEFIRSEVPTALVSIHAVRPPKVIRHPAGFTVTAAPVRTFLKSALLISGQKALGRRFGGHPFYEEVERELALGIMRSHFHHGYPKGAHCCAQCTLAVHPVLVARAIRYFDCEPLARDVRAIVRGREWRFKGAVNPAMVRWSLGGDPPRDPT